MGDACASNGSDNGWPDMARYEITQKMADSGFIGQPYVDMLVYADGTQPVLDAFRDYVPPPPKWSQANPRP